MNLHEALVIFGLDYTHYTQQDVEQAYVLCKKIAPDWLTQLNAGKKALEDALQAHTYAAIKLAELRRGIYVPSATHDARKPSARAYTEINLFQMPAFIPSMETFSSSLIPLLYRVSEPHSINDPRAIPPCTTSHLTVALDLDETLLHARGGPISIRHYARTLLKTLSELEDADGQPAIELILFSAGDQQHVDICRRILDPKNALFKHSICRGDNWINSSFPLKDLSLLSRPSCLLVDDVAYATVKNGHSALIVPAFDPKKHYQAVNDKTLLYVLEIVTRTSHLLSLREPIAHPIPRFGRKYILERPAFCDEIDVAMGRKNAADAKRCIEASNLAFKEARHAKISAQLVAIKAKIETYVQADGQFTGEAIQTLLQDRLFTSAVNAVRTGVSLATAAKYILNIARDSGGLTAADLAADNPFVVVSLVPTFGDVLLNCLRLDVSNVRDLDARVKRFIAKQEKIAAIQQAEITPLTILATQVNAEQLLAIFTEAQLWWAANEESALDHFLLQAHSSTSEEILVIPPEPSGAPSAFFKPPSPVQLSVDDKDKKPERTCIC